MTPLPPHVTAQDLDARIDAIVVKPGTVTGPGWNAARLNALHACRPGHPLGRGRNPGEVFMDAWLAARDVLGRTDPDVQWLKASALDRAKTRA